MRSCFLSSIYILVSFFLLASCSDTNDPVESPSSAKGLYSTLAADARFSTLSDALQRTGLDLILDAPASSYTFFAPTNTAFSAFFSSEGYADLDAAQAAIGNSGLKDLLSYHMLAGNWSTATLSTGYFRSCSATKDGDSLSVYLDVEALKLNGTVAISEVNKSAVNGTYHVVDNVNQALSVFGLIEVNPMLSSFEAALGLAVGNLPQRFMDPTMEYTLFAPENNAFDNLVAATPNVTNLFEFVASLGTSQLAEVLLYHALTGKLESSKMQTGNVLSLGVDSMGNSLEFFINIGTQIKLIDKSSSTSDAQLLERDLVATNGIVHFLDGVLLPN
jgi:uncharacterized surface protein with fasciclin (FAS1) repeats